MELGNRIRELRRKLDLTQEELGNKIKESKSTVANWETGYSKTTIEQLIKLSKIFNVTTDYLLGLEIIKKEDNQRITELENQLAKYKCYFDISMLAASDIARKLNEEVKINE